jgi:transcriptional regulator with XRE-family HTH domain
MPLVERTSSPESTAADPAPAGTDEDRWLGARLRSARKERKLSIQMLADRSSLSSAMVSQIERGLSTPSIRSLRLLGIALGMPMSWFFGGPPHEESGDSPYVVRRGNRRLLRLTPTGVMKELLTPTTPGLLEMYEICLAAGGTSGPEFYQHAQGEKAGLVVEGVLELFIDNQTQLLNEGDTFRFPSVLPHRFGNPGTTATRLIWVITPPVVKPSA